MVLHLIQESLYPVKFEKHGANTKAKTKRKMSGHSNHSMVFLIKHIFNERLLGSRPHGFKGENEMSLPSQSLPNMMSGRKESGMKG